MGFRRVFTRKEGGSRGKGVFKGQWNAIGYRRQAQLMSRKVSIFCFARGSSIQAVQTLFPPLVCSHFFLLSWRLPGAWVCWLPWDVGKIDVTDDESWCSLNHPFHSFFCSSTQRAIYISLFPAQSVEKTDSWRLWPHDCCPRCMLGEMAGINVTPRDW